MKTKLKLSILSLIISSACFAQIPNPSFENLDSTNTPLNWIYTGAVSIGIGDSILTDGPLISKSNDAHSGQYALELRNSYNYTTNTPFMNGTANATLPDTTMYQGFTQFLVLPSKPYAIDFYYKYAQNPFNDSTICTVTVFNSDLAEIGNGLTKFWDNNPIYQLKTVAINYFNLIDIAMGDSIPAFISVQFKNKVTTSIPHVGQRTLIDDVAVNYNPLGLNSKNKHESLKLYPNPASNQLIVLNAPNYLASIYTIDGKLMLNQNLNLNNTIDVRDLSSGVYLVKLTNTAGFSIQEKFIKE
jgi:hypothetical protein